MRLLVGNRKCVASVFLTILIVLGMSGAGYADMTPVSDRTPQVRDAIVDEVPGVNNAADVTERHLSRITGLYFRSKGITALKAGDFDGLSSLRMLDLRGNHLTSLPSGVFNGLSDLTTLHLRDNDLTSLPRRVFSDLSDLRSLYLHGNHLTSLPSGVFNGLSILRELYLYENDLTSLPVGVFNDLSNLRTLHLHKNDLTSLPSGVFNSLSKLSVLYLYENDLTSLPAGVFNSLSNLRTLNLYENGLTSLPVGVFDGLSNLTSLGLSSNGLTSLPAGVFNDLSDLRLLSLYENDLTRLPAGLFNGVSGLTGLYLFNNDVNPLPLMVSLEKVADGQFKAVAPAGAPFAIILPVSVVNGSISGSATTVTIPAGSVESETFTVTGTPGTTGAVTVDIGTLPSLPRNHFGYAVVRAADLPLEVIAGSFLNSRTPAVRDAIVEALPGVESASDVTEAHLSMIRLLDLSNRGISTLNAGDFDGLSALRTLYLDNNNLTTLPADVFDGLSALTRLSFNNNALTSLPSDVFNSLTSLTALSLYDNALTSLPSDVFNSLSALEVIYIFNNDLTTLPSDVFDGLASLKVLYISANDLTTLPSDVFNGLAALHSLALSNNDLTTLPEGVFNGLSALTTLYLGGNEVNPLPLTVSFEKVADGAFKAVAPVGAPFEMVLPLTVTNGSITGGATTATIPAGGMESETLTVTRTPDTTGAITVDIGSLPSLPQNHSGYMLSKSADLPLTIIDAVSNNAPVFADGTSTTRSIAENSAADVNIGAAITATDTDNDTLTYTLSGTDAAAFRIDGTIGQLKTKSALDYETKPAYTVMVTVSDGTLTNTISATINVSDIEEAMLTARFEGLPASHDRSAFTFELHFSTDITISYINVRDDVLDVTGGDVTKARRLVQGSNQGWEVTLEPASNAAVSITLRPTTDCEAASAVCTADGRLLSNEVSGSVPGPEAAEAPGIVTANVENALLSNYPNPFNPETWIPYHLAQDANVILHIYALNGMLVRTLDLGHQPVGIYQSRSRAAYWDGRNASGEFVSSGIYFYRLTAADFTATRKMIILK